MNNLMTYFDEAFYMINTIMVYLVYALVLALASSELTLPEMLFRESANKDTRYEVTITAEKKQHIEDGLRFIVEIENKTAETIRVKVQRRNPPFRYQIFGEGFIGTNESMDTEISLYANPLTRVCL